MTPPASKTIGNQAAEQIGPTFFEIKRMKEAAFPFAVFVSFVTFVAVHSITSSGIAIVAMMFAFFATQIVLVRSAMKPRLEQPPAGKLSEHPAE